MLLVYSCMYKNTYESVSTTVYSVYKWAYVKQNKEQIRNILYCTSARFSVVRLVIQRWDFYSFSADAFNLRFFTPEPWPRFSLVCIATQITDCYWSEESFLSLIGFHSRYTNRDRSSLGRYVFGSEISYNKAPPRLPGLGC